MGNLISRSLKQMPVAKPKTPIASRGKHGGPRPNAGRKPGQVSQLKLDLKSMAQGYAQKALSALVEVCEDKKAPHAARVSAANSLLDRGYGKPIQFVDAHVETVGNVGVYKVTRDKAFELQLAEKGVTLTPDDEDYDTSEAVEEAF